MKRIVKRFMISFMVLFLLHCSYAQSNMSPELWKEDVEHLQKVVHAQYPFLFKKVSVAEFDAAVDALTKKIPSMEEHEIVVGIAELVAMFKYGHTVLWLTQWRYNENRGFHQLPINYYWFKDGIYIQGAHKDYQELVGARVLKIGRLAIDDALEAIKPVVSAENNQFFKAHGINYLGVPEVLHAKRVIPSMEYVDLELEKEGKRFKAKVRPVDAFAFPGKYSLILNGNDWSSARKEGNDPLWLKNLEKIYHYEYLPESKTVYVRQSQIQNDPNQKNVEDFYTEVFEFIENNQVERMILDVRQNSGGNNYLNKPVITGLIKSKINEKGRLYVVIGRRTFSACQNLVNEIENYTNAIFVGEPTAENVNFYGDVNTEILPNSKIPIRLSHAWWQDKDPRDMRPWTAPSIPVELSFSDYQNNYDPTIDIILTSSKLELELKEVLMEKDDDKLLSIVDRYQSNPDYSFYSWENWINLAGYQAINEGNAQRAFKLFKLNAELFPNSANVWDSLAEGYWRTGDQEKARELYNKVLEMAPNSRVAEHSQMMLDYMDRN